MSGFPDVPRFTLADHRTWEGDWELWDGIPVAMSPSPVSRHQGIALEVAALAREQLRRRAGCRCRVRLELDWHAGEDTLFRPDVMVLCGEDLDHDYPTRPPALIVEVLSPSTRHIDLGFKRRRYRACGVPNYFVVDPEDGLLERLLGEDGHRRSDAVTVRLHEGCEVTLPRRIPPDV